MSNQMSTTLRKRTVIAKDCEEVWATVQINVWVRDRRLTRDEHDQVLHEITSGVMALMPGVTYLRVPLSKLKVMK